jgi:hypothetical protein
MTMLSEAKASPTAGFTPVPLRFTVCVLPASPPLLSVIVSVPASVAAVVGRNVTLIAQDPPAAILTAQLLVWLKLALVAKIEMVSAASPVPVRLTVCAGTLPLLAIVIAHLLLPAVVGVKVTLMVQLEFANELGQLFL